MLHRERNHFPRPRSHPATKAYYSIPLINQPGANMWKLFSLLYRQYCHARLAEIHKFNHARTA